MQEVRNFVRKTIDAFNRRDSDAVCSLIMLGEGDPNLQQLQSALYDMTDESIRATVQQEIKNESRQLKDLISNYLVFTIASCLEKSSMVDVYELLSACYGSFLSLYVAQDAQWLSLLMMNLSYSLVDWAIIADQENPNAKELRISDAASKHLSKAINIVISDKTSNTVEESKRVSLYYLANLMFRIYFKLKSTRLMPTLINNISKAGADLSQYPMSQRVTHQYYLGRYHLYQLDLRRAERELDFAFRNRPDFVHDEYTDKITFSNGRLILIYLTACRLCLGRIPSTQLLQEYNLYTFFGPLITAIKSGNLKLLHQTLAIPQFVSWFVKKEIYFLLKEKLDTLTGDNTYDILDIECITASLLDQGYIKGYIHSKKKILVLGKTNPFPIVYSVEVMEEVIDTHK
ncbi:hypothetical protein B0O80DRAFT_520893 [Mortierella sp. GBAus27b]|nr:hypothetical protein B0O80DRAFT_520893 [Mortierella sp. GBAus27b]